MRHGVLDGVRAISKLQELQTRITQAQITIERDLAHGIETFANIKDLQKMEPAYTAYQQFQITILDTINRLIDVFAESEEIIRGLQADINQWQPEITAMRRDIARYEQFLATLAEDDGFTEEEGNEAGGA